MPIFNRIEGHKVSSQLKPFYDLKLFGKFGLKLKQMNNKNHFLD